MSTLIANLNNASRSELNDIWTMVLYKGHNKDKEIDRSYRTILTEGTTVNGGRYKPQLNTKGRVLPMILLHFF